MSAVQDTSTKILPNKLVVTSGSFVKNPLRETTQDAEVGTMPTVELPTLVPLQVGKPARKEEAIPIDF